MNISFDLNWQIEHEGQHKVDPVLFQLLKAIDELGSLKKATEKTAVSYRFAWGLLTKWEAQLGKPLVQLERGRGAQLTKLGQTLLHADDQLHAKFSPELANFANHTKQALNALLSEQTERPLSIFASHGLAITKLREHLASTHVLELDVHFHGSIESLNAMHKGECDIAGFHIPEGPLGQRLLKHYQHLIPAKQYQLIYVVKRNQGLMCKPEHAKQLSNLAELARSSLRFINRQPNSGTRLLLDQLLENANINSQQIKGYEHEEFTHMAVAAMIASGAADVGFGIAPIAEQFKLAFIPMVWEHYCLAIPNTIIHEQHVQTMINVLSNPDYQQPLNQHVGYDCTLSGQTVQLNDLVS